MTDLDFMNAARAASAAVAHLPLGRIVQVAGQGVVLSGLGGQARLGDRVRLFPSGPGGEVIRTEQSLTHVLLDGPSEGLSVGDPATLAAPPLFAPDDSWIGRVIDPDGQPLDGRALFPGPVAAPLQADPPAAGRRRALGARVATGLSVFDTLLPLARGQRIGLFAGSGVGKSTLLAQLARGVAADVIVIGLVGERGRELREFIEKVLGPDGMKRTVIIAATSDRAPQTRRRCALAATAVAEHFRETGRHVLLLIDSVTRFAEAHRELSVAAGEPAGLLGFPASTPAAIAGLCERAGPGLGQGGDITAIYTVLVAGSDMEEPVADMLRGVLDGHVVLDRDIAERGRFPAVDVVRSVSRSLPDVATNAQNALIAEARRHLGTYARAELMIQSGLYAKGSDPAIDQAIACRDGLEAFVARPSPEGPEDAFRALQKALRPPRDAGSDTPGRSSI